MMNSKQKVIGVNSVLREYKSQLEEEMVLHFVSVNPGLNIYSIAKYLKMNRSSLLKIINKLEDIGILKTDIITNCESIILPLTCKDRSNIYVFDVSTIELFWKLIFT